MTRDPEVDVQRRRAEDAETMVADLVTRVEELKADLAATRLELEARERRIADLERLLHETSKAHGFRGGDLADRERKLQGLAQELDRKGAEIARLGAALERNQAELDRVRTEANQEIAALREIIDTHVR